ncbi:uncharacterized protein CEXT_299231 [Caerostris extrusa]|uniref:Uncharacterized protein n=1 Tax=Caerostris extrusa TaxID=172846 RepID=A0AAV4WJT6_CAEEX|nr:uncharacterized protein CEXT_299231 [Caerostris extrusa]
MSCSSPWGEWSPCSGSCGGGIQQRRRQCDGSGKCSNEEGQQRTCNMFPCTGILNILEVAGVHRSALRPAGRPTAYKLLPSGTWRSGKEEIVFPRTFPGNSPLSDCQGKAVFKGWISAQSSALRFSSSWSVHQ